MYEILNIDYLSVFSPRGVTPTSKFVCVFPFPDGSARRHKDLSWFGQEKALRPAGEGSSCYLAPKCSYRGEYKRGVKYGSSTVYGVVLCVVVRVYSRVSPFTVPRRDLGYMYRYQSRGR